MSGSEIAAHADEDEAEERSIEQELELIDQERARLGYRSELLEAIREGLEQIAAGQGIPHEQVFAELRAKYGRLSGS